MNNIVEAIVEIPLKTKNKFEIDEKSKKIKLDRVLYSAMNYPSEYGYIENTLALDGDPLDILIITSEATFPGCIVPARVIGYLDVIDNGFQDYKLISVVNVDPRYNDINELSDLSTFTLDEIKDFFKNYKTLQKINVVVKEYHNKEEALKLIENCQKRFLKNKEIDELKITALKIKLTNTANTKAICEVKFTNNETLKEVIINEKNHELFVTIKDKEFIETFPSHHFLEYLNKTIISKYNQIVKENNRD